MSTWENIEPQYHTAIKLSLTGCSQCSGWAHHSAMLLWVTPEGGIPPNDPLSLSSHIPASQLLTKSPPLHFNPGSAGKLCGEEGGSIKWGIKAPVFLEISTVHIGNTIDRKFYFFLQMQNNMTNSTYILQNVLLCAFFVVVSAWIKLFKRIWFYPDQMKTKQRKEFLK